MYKIHFIPSEAALRTRRTIPTRNLYVAYVVDTYVVMLSVYLSWFDESEQSALEICVQDCLRLIPYVHIGELFFLIQFLLT